MLVVEDDPDIRDVLQHNLEAARFQVAVAQAGLEALTLYATELPDVIVLDIMLPDISGTEVCRRLRAARGQQPAILMLTAKGEEIDRVVGLEVGADDYVVKPFSVRELVLRVQSLARRQHNLEPGPPPPPARVTLGPLELDIPAHRAFVGAEAPRTEVHLSATEFKLLVHLVERRGRVVSRENLLSAVWDYNPDVETRTVDTHVKRLRDKLRQAGRLIETVRGAGYRLSDDEKSSLRD